TYLDAAPARRDIPPMQGGTPAGTGAIISDPFRIILSSGGSGGAQPHTTHEPCARNMITQKIRRERGGGDDRSKSDPRSVFRREDHIVYTECTETCTECSVPVREECERPLQKDIDASIPVPRDKNRGMSFIVEVLSDTIAVLVQ